MVHSSTLPILATDASRSSEAGSDECLNEDDHATPLHVLGPNHPSTAEATHAKRQAPVNSEPVAKAEPPFTFSQTGERQFKIQRSARQLQRAESRTASAPHGHGPKAERRNKTNAYLHAHHSGDRGRRRAISDCTLQTATIRHANHRSKRDGTGSR